MVTLGQLFHFVVGISFFSSKFCTNTGVFTVNGGMAAPPSLPSSLKRGVKNFGKVFGGGGGGSKIFILMGGGVCWWGGGVVM